MKQAYFYHLLAVTAKPVYIKTMTATQSVKHIDSAIASTKRGVDAMEFLVPSNAPRALSRFAYLNGFDARLTHRSTHSRQKVQLLYMPLEVARRNNQNMNPGHPSDHLSSTPSPLAELASLRSALCLQDGPRVTVTLLVETNPIYSRVVLPS